jgi:hypothetical protein
MEVRKTNVKARVQRKAVESDLGFHWGAANSLLLGAGVAAVVTGFFTLSKGSLTLAPVLLVLGYVGLIPASLVLRGRNQGSGE